MNSMNKINLLPPSNSSKDKHLKTWKERQVRESPHFSFKAKAHEKNIQIKPHIDDQSLTDMEKYETQAAGLCAAMEVSNLNPFKILSCNQKKLVDIYNLRNPNHRIRRFFNGYNRRIIKIYTTKIM